MMLKRFWKLKRGEQFDSGDGWDFLKLGLFTARAAHSFTHVTFRRWPWETVNTIEPNPNCTKQCPCKIKNFVVDGSAVR